MHIGIRVTDRTREARREQSALEVGYAGHADAGSIQIGSRSPLGGVQIVMNRVVNDARKALTTAPDADAHAEPGKSVGEVRRPVQRVHVPCELAGALVSPALFGNDRMGRELRADAIHDPALGGSVRCRHRVERALVLDLHSLVVAHEDLPCPASYFRCEWDVIGLGHWRTSKLAAPADGPVRDHGCGRRIGSCGRPCFDRRGTLLILSDSFSSPALPRCCGTVRRLTGAPVGLCFVGLRFGGLVK